jgi:glycosyltransferase involved in cell wall biosynthesis
MIKMITDKTQKHQFVSVVVCTYNRKTLLRSCLASIYAQNYSRSHYEVIVVDGGSTDGTHGLCREFPKIRFMVERKHGLAYARNKGAELARGDIVAYTDDDCIVDRHWLKNLVAGFQFSKNVVGVGGPVHPLHPEIIPKKINVKAALGLYDEGKTIKITQAIITSNSAFKKEIFKTIKFDESLGITRRGKLILCGEDTDFCQTLIDYGYKLLYTPYAKVYHQILRERIRAQYIFKRAVHNGLSQTAFYLKKEKSRIWAIRYAFGQLVQQFLATISDRSFTSCYNLIYSISTLFFCFSGLDRILFRTPST